MSLLLHLSFEGGGSESLVDDPVPGAYKRMLSALLPPGRPWRLIGDSYLGSLIAGCADELARVHGRVADMLNEADPTATTELLPEYEAELGLVNDTSVDERRARIVARLIARQRFRPVDFQQALAPLLAQDPDDVVVLERTAAFAASIGDVREIFRFFIYRDPGEPGTYFIDSAQELVDQIKPTHTAGQVIESVDALYDDELSLYDRDLLGA